MATFEQKIKQIKRGPLDKAMQFIDDDNEFVRAALASRGDDKILDVLVHDDSVEVVSRVLSHRRDKDLDILVNHPNSVVRGRVAEIGRSQDLDILANDDAFYVVLKVLNHRRKKDWDAAYANVMNSPSDDWEDPRLVKLKHLAKLYTFK